MTHDIHTFQEKIWNFYKDNKREFPWRDTDDPYKIFISEIMLQQTQTFRVLPKYEAFVKKFPNFTSLAHASFSEILSVWSGLGYNRRAMFLKRAAETLVQDYNMRLPSTYEQLIRLPGVGKNTAGSLMAFAFNTKVVFIETNIRRVFIHEFFLDTAKVPDSAIIPLIERTLPGENYRDWYYALMDYGAFLGKHVENPNKRSKHYTVQSPLKGSKREVRGKILKSLLTGKQSQSELYISTNLAAERIDIVLEELVNEGLIIRDNERYALAE